MQVSINYWAVLVAAIVNIVLGAIWYSPPLFGGTWMRLTRKTMEDMRGQSPARGYLLTFIGALVASYVLAMPDQRRL